MWDYRLDLVSAYFEQFFCNLDCFFCHKDYFTLPKIKKKELKLSEGVSLCSSILKGPYTIHLTGSGEPLLVPTIYFNETINELMQSDNCMKISLTTNGYYLFSWIKNLKRIGIRDINISLPTLNCDQYAKIMQTDISRAENIIKNVKKGIICAKNAGLNIDLNICLVSYMPEKHLDEILFFSEENDLSLKVFPLINLDYPTKEPKAFIQDFIKMLNKKGKLNMKETRRYLIQEWQIGKVKLLIKEDQKDIKPIQCRECIKRDYCVEACWKSVRITKWSVQPCCVRDDNIYWYEENDLDSLSWKLKIGGKTK